MDASDPIEPTSPDPKRYWWLKRLSLAALLLIVLLVGLRLVWGQRVQARLDETIADIHAKGEPILFSDLTIDPLTDTENGAWYLTQAGQQWPGIPGQPGVNIHDTDWYLEGEEAGFTDPITDNAAYLASCQPVLDILRQAREVERSTWSTTLTRPLLDALLPQLGESRRLARLVDDVGQRAIQTGDTELIFDTMLMQHTIARHVQGQFVVIIDSLVAISIMAMNREFIEKALPQIDPAELREGRARELAEQVIASLTDGMLGEGFIQSFVGERAACYDFYECLIDGTASAQYFMGYGDPIEWIIDTPGLSHAYRPVLKNTQHVTLGFYNDVLDALRSSNASIDYEQVTQDLEEEIYAHPMRYPLAGMLLPAYSAAVRTYHRSEALLACAATAIAIKLYEADHGQRPDTLAQLVPKYLPAIPIDPFSKTGEPIRYNSIGIVPSISDPYNLTDQQLEELKQRAIRPYPLLYSVGEDGQDQNGGPLSIDSAGELDDSSDGRYRSDGQPGDIWFLLDPWPQRIFTDQDLWLDVDPYDLDSF